VGREEERGDVKRATGSNPGAFTKVCTAGLPDGNLHVVGLTATGGLFHMMRYANGSWSAMGDIKAQTGNRGRSIEVGCVKL
jgi:hypothetical protein